MSNTAAIAMFAVIGLVVLAIAILLILLLVPSLRRRVFPHRDRGYYEFTTIKPSSSERGFKRV